MMLLAQAAIETVKTSSYVTGKFVIDGALLIAGLKTVELIVSKVRTRRNGGNVQAKIESLEKRPTPGGSLTCREHGEAIAGLVQFRETTSETITKIDGKLDRLIEKFIGKP